jgi:hypothetical protein
MVEGWLGFGIEKAGGDTIAPVRYCIEISDEPDFAGEDFWAGRGKGWRGLTFGGYGVLICDRFREC